MTQVRALILALFSLCLAEGVLAEDQRAWLHPHDAMPPSYLRIHEPTTSGASASVSFWNTQVHGADDTFDLTYRKGDVVLTVTVYFEWNVDGWSERVTVIPPDGYVAIPQEMTVEEDSMQTLHIFKMTLG